MDKIISGNEWLQIKQKSNGYTYSHEVRCNGVIVAILPYKYIIDYSLTELGMKKIMYLGRYEVCPAHSNNIELCSITGGYDDLNLTYKETAIKELEEEAGYVTKEKYIIELGSLKPSKSADTIVYLYAVNIDDCEQITPKGDGTELEKSAYCDWIDKKTAIWSKDPLLTTMVSRLETELTFQFSL